MFVHLHSTLSLHLNVDKIVNYLHETEILRINCCLSYIPNACKWHYSRIRINHFQWQFPIILWNKIFIAFSLSLFLSYVRSIYASRKCQINQFYLKIFDKCAFFRHPQIDLPNGKNRNPQPKLPNAYSNFTIGWKNYGKCKEIKKLFWIGYEYHLDNKYFNITLHSFEYSWWAFIWGMCYELWITKDEGLINLWPFFFIILNPYAICTLLFIVMCIIGNEYT